MQRQQPQRRSPLEQDLRTLNSPYQEHRPSFHNHLPGITLLSYRYGRISRQILHIQQTTNTHCGTSMHEEHQALTTSPTTNIATFLRKPRFKLAPAIEASLCHTNTQTRRDHRCPGQTQAAVSRAVDGAYGSRLRPMLPREIGETTPLLNWFSGRPLNARHPPYMLLHDVVETPSLSL